MAVVRKLPGAKFVPKEKTEDGVPYWTIPAEWDVARRLEQDVKGSNNKLSYGEELTTWAKEMRGEITELTGLSTADWARLENVPEEAEDLARALHVGPIGLSLDEAGFEEALAKDPSYQTADVRFMARARNPANFNEPGTGKTLEVIGAAIEGGNHIGPCLVIAPKTSLDVVWGNELERWQDFPVLVAPEGRAARLELMQTVEFYIKEDISFWLVVNPAMLTFRQVKQEDKHGVERTTYFPPFPTLMTTEWSLVAVDEFHKMGLADPATLTARAMNSLKSKKRMATSGTPFGGKPIKLYGLLHWLHPEQFSSKWRWAEQWLVVSEGNYGKDIGGLRRCPKHIGKSLEQNMDCERCQAILVPFWEMLDRYAVRRTKAQVLPWLPPKQHSHLFVKLDGKQKEQYVTFAAEAEIRIEEEELSATSILAEYTRLKQLADSACAITVRPDGAPTLTPVGPSAKLPVVLELLEERGITGVKGEKEGTEQVVIFSQFSTVVDWITKELQDAGMPADKLTGNTTRKQREVLIKNFQEEGGLRVLAMTTTAGGVSITLDRASTVIFLDETWDPDDQTQAEDRVHRGSRIHQVTIYYIRARDTIEEYIYKRTKAKQAVNRVILDLRRRGLRAV